MLGIVDSMRMWHINIVLGVVNRAVFLVVFNFPVNENGHLASSS